MIASVIVAIIYVLLAGNKDSILMISGNGDVVEPDDQVAAIGSGGPMALAAARALLENTDMPAEDIVREALRIAAAVEF